MAALATDVVDELDGLKQTLDIQQGRWDSGRMAI
jgi:hypothetical protein